MATDLVKRRAKQAAYQAKYRRAHRAEVAKYQAKYRRQHREELRAHQALYRRDHRGVMATYDAKRRATPEYKAKRLIWCASYYQRHREGMLSYYKSRRENLHESYIRTQLRLRTGAKVPQELIDRLIEAKRAQLLLMRATR